MTPRHGNVHRSGHESTLYITLQKSNSLPDISNGDGFCCTEQADLKTDGSTGSQTCRNSFVSCGLSFFSCKQIQQENSVDELEEKYLELTAEIGQERDMLWFTFKDTRKCLWDVGAELFKTTARKKDLLERGISNETEMRLHNTKSAELKKIVDSIIIDGEKKRRKHGAEFFIEVHMGYVGNFSRVLHLPRTRCARRHESSIFLGLLSSPGETAERMLPNWMVCYVRVRGKLHLM